MSEMINTGFFFDKIKKSLKIPKG